MILKGMVVRIQESDYTCLFNLSQKNWIVCSNSKNKLNCLFKNALL